MCESASFKNWRSGETSIVTFGAKTLRNQVQNRNSDQSFSEIGISGPKKAGIKYGIEIPTGIPPEFAT
jgi:hypothetical protein